MHATRVLPGAALLLLLTIPLRAAGQASGPPPQAQSHRPVVEHALKSDLSPALRNVPPLPPPLVPRLNEMRRPRPLPGRQAHLKLGADPVIQTSPGALAMPSPSGDFEGIDNPPGDLINLIFPPLPPDTNGAVGPNHYVQWVNLSFAVFTKSGTLVYGPAAGNTLWTGFGSDLIPGSRACESDNDGDPIVLYDKQAHRWLMSQLAIPNFPSGPFYQCVAVSQTDDPTGAFYRYVFQLSDRFLNDYPKWGVWGDAYYLAVNQFLCADDIFGVQCSWAGQGAFAFERAQMLAGQPARMVGFTLPTSNLGGMLPADLDGPTPPPAGSPNYFVQVDDGVWFTPPVPDRLQVWPFHVDWTTPTNSTFGPVGATDTGVVLPTAPFDSNMCGYSPNCIPQPGTDPFGDPAPPVDALADRLMYRLAYRNFGDHESLVLNHTVDVDGTDHAGVRWYEVRHDPASGAAGGWTIRQQGTYAPDARHRWMGSIAMDGAGNIALGYSLSDGTVTSPSIAYTGRLAGDPLGQLPQGEVLAMAGAGSQLDSSGRWGDYSAMSVDPTDDCTFWYTQEYYASTDFLFGRNWQTRIIPFKFASCGSTSDSPPSVAITSPASGATVAGTVPVTATASDDHGVTQVAFAVDGHGIGVDTDGSNGWSTSWNTAAYANGGHTLTATATDTAGQTTTSAPVPVTVSNATASPTNMGVFSISWQSGKNLTLTVNIRRDSNTSGTLTSGDAVVSGAAVTLVLTRDSNGNGAFECGGADRCWTFKGNTNSNGNFQAKLVGAPAGRYQARVTQLTRSTYTWAPALDVDNPDTFTK
jgi:Bacterial Ig domain